MPFAYGLYSAANQTPVYRFAITLEDLVQRALSLTAEELPTLTGLRPTHFLQPARGPGEGVTINAGEARQSDLILLSGFFDQSNEIRLIHRDGRVVARWPVRFSALFPDTSHLDEPPETDWNIDLHGALALPDGSIAFNFEHGGLVKLDRCGGLLWRLKRQTHHSLERAVDGGYWVPARRIRRETRSPFPPFVTPLGEDLLLHVSEDGRVTTEISLPQLFYDNGLEPLITATGEVFRRNMAWDHEIFHLNKIDVLTARLAPAFPNFAAGDLLLSLRTYNMLVVLDPDSREIKWWQIGPWRRQHDPEFAPGGEIFVFNNNDYALGEHDDARADLSPQSAGSTVLALDPVRDRVRVVYGAEDGQAMYSRWRGKVEATPSGGVLVTEFEAGRVFEVGKTGRIVWEYINRYDADTVAEITEARLYPATYFRVSDWSCPIPRE